MDPTGLTELAAALRGRAEELAHWHDSLTKLMVDPRVENQRRREDPDGPAYDEHGTGPYCGAVAR
ncbi:hypothetical protein JL475_37375 [Streptomyces sp. M2CJ-2]|uniref:hypothetical protein n=1 Tax=Streptomyces sp. M2CJ-2 TaxID=2803948 RepID=UPI00192824A5|nr:hypothetical protein [Streptomyces sp. M2CJ-2]MBL3671464.1 hypothetical protein [Streptomyces sp. M2CJ-2]